MTTHATMHPAVMAELALYLEDPCEALGAAKPCPFEEDDGSGPPSAGLERLARIEPCEHILAMWRVGRGLTCRIDAVSAASLLADENDEFCRLPYRPIDYREPPLAPPDPHYPNSPTASYRFPKEQELDLFDARAGILEADDPPVYSLRRPDDILAPRVDEVSEQGERGKSASGLTTWASMAERERQEQREREYRSVLDRLAERAERSLGPRGRAIHRDYERRIAELHRICEARSYECFRRPGRTAAESYQAVAAMNLKHRAGPPAAEQPAAPATEKRVA